MTRTENLKIENISFDFSAIIKRSRDIATKISGGIDYLFKKNKGELEEEKLRPTLFVPMTGAAEATRDVYAAALGKPDPAD